MKEKRILEEVMVVIKGSLGQVSETRRGASQRDRLGHSAGFRVRVRVRGS